MSSISLKLQWQFSACAQRTIQKWYAGYKQYRSHGFGNDDELIHWLTYTVQGNDFVRGVSGGERKRVSIAEMALAGSPIAAWDNSTRGLDSATALTFTKSLRLNANIVGSTHAVAIYQA